MACFPPGSEQSNKFILNKIRITNNKCTQNKDSNKTLCLRRTTINTYWPHEPAKDDLPDNSTRECQRLRVRANEILYLSLCITPPLLQ